MIDVIFYFGSFGTDSRPAQMNIPLIGLQYLLKNSCSRETSYAPDKWTPDNSLYGHCTVAALVAQDFFGGKLKSSRFPKDWAKKLGSRLHYWNELPDGTIVDLTGGQFPKEFLYKEFIRGDLNKILDKSRSGVLSFPETRRRYEILKEKVDSLLKSNPLFKDEKFQRCWELAFSGEAVCPKMRFACLVYKDGELVAQSTNKNFTKQFGKERLCSFDGSSCVRMGIESRMDATLGDCGHAPIWCIKQVLDEGYRPADLNRFDFYEGGFWPDGTPWERSEPSYSCTYCQNMFAIFGLEKIYGAFGGAWQPLWTKDSLYSSVEYAKGTKKV